MNNSDERDYAEEAANRQEMEGEREAATGKWVVTWTTVESHKAILTDDEMADLLGVGHGDFQLKGDACGWSPDMIEVCGPRDLADALAEVEDSTDSWRSTTREDIVLKRKI